MSCRLGCRVLIILAVLCCCGSYVLAVPPYCGNNSCDNGETCSTCPGDCGACRCGNGTCDPGESCSSCPGDCGPCADSCYGRCGGTAPAGCACDAGCSVRGDCCADATTKCTDIPVPSSCQRGFCGKSWNRLARPVTVCDINGGYTDCGYANPCWTETHYDGQGCSCDPNCGHTGNCCADAAQYCDTSDGEIDPVADAGALMDGEQFYRWSNPASVSSSNGRGTQIAYLGVDDPAAGALSAAGLTKVSFHEMVGHTEDARCSIERTTQGSGTYWNVTAFTVKRADFGNKGEIDANCAGESVRWPATLSPASRPTLGGEVPSIAWDDTDSWESYLGPNSATTFPFLTWVAMADLKDQGEPASCLIHLADRDSNGVYRPGWYLQAVSSRDSRVNCRARVLNLGSSGLTRAACPLSGPETYFGNGCDANGHCASSGDCVDGGRFRAHASGTNSPAIQTARVRMVPARNNACFLTQVYFEDLDDPEENTTCEITKSDDYLYLTATATQDLDAHCNAMCLRLPDAQTRPAPAVQITGALGERMTLFQGGGSYDKPVVFFEGFDPTNDGDAAAFERDYGTFLRRGATQGVDIWHVSFRDGGQAILESARQAAEAIDTAYKYSNWNVQNPGRRMAAVGVSMGALAGRVALASWEAGRYNCAPGTGECISPSLGDGTPRPPVAVYGSVGGPHQGASIPVSLQTLVQDIGNQWDVGKPLRMVNSPAATNMLYARIDDRCGDPAGVVTDICLDHNTLRDGNLVLDGQGECEQFLNSNCASWRNGVCIDPATSHDPFFADVNTRNGNGFPHGVATLGLTNGTFNWPAYGVGTSMGHLLFQDYGAPSCGGLSACSRNTDVNATIVEPRPAYATDLERLPGDLYGLPTLLRSAAGSVPVPKHVKLVDLVAGTDFTFIPTESALSCPGVRPGVDCTPGVNCDAVCAARSQFSKVASSSAAASGPHSTLVPLRASQLLAFLYDAFLDGDGLCSTANPLAFAGPTYIGCVGPDDCTEAVPEGAPCDGPDEDLCKEGVFHCGTTPQCSDTTGTNVESCNGVDDDCDGVVDENPACCTTITLKSGRCAACEYTGQTFCGPGSFLCCPTE